MRSSATIEQVMEDRARRHVGGPGAPEVRWAVEATYEGSIRFEEEHLDEPETIEPMIGALTRWVASSLVQLADLPLKFLPPDPEEAETG